MHDNVIPLPLPPSKAIPDCPHGDDPNSCPPCVRVTLEQPEEEQTSVVMTARYEGTCLRCGDEIEPGTKIGLIESEDIWVHVHCPDG